MNFVFSLVQQNDLGLVVSNTVEVVSDAGRCLVSFECSSHHYDSFGFQYLVMTLGVGLSILEVENVWIFAMQPLFVASPRDQQLFIVNRVLLARDGDLAIREVDFLKLTLQHLNLGIG